MHVFLTNCLCLNQKASNKEWVVYVVFPARTLLYFRIEYLNILEKITDHTRNILCLIDSEDKPCIWYYQLCYLILL